MDKPLILIVDDEHANQFLLEGLLSVNGFNTASCSNGIDCLDYLKTNRPDLILLDIMMPKMSGIEALKVIMADDSLKRIPVLMVSAKTGTIDIKEALELGAIDYVRKPFDEIELLARVKVGLRIKQNEDNLRVMVANRDTFVRIISHDLRSPFTAIYGLAEILIGDENLTKDQKESIGYIIDSIEYSLAYFNKLLSWTQLEHHEIQLEKKEIFIAELINKVIYLLSKKAIEKGVTITNAIESDLLLKVDDTFFRQVIANIIGNALKYTPTGGSINCSSEKNNDRVSLIISDTGIGMSDNITNENLFETSIISSRKGTNGEKGTGIGLGICKKILGAHNMNIIFKRNPDKGTSFIISTNAQ